MHRTEISLFQVGLGFGLRAYPTMSGPNPVGPFGTLPHLQGLDRLARLDSSLDVGGFGVVLADIHGILKCVFSSSLIWRSLGRDW